MAALPPQIMHRRSSAPLLSSPFQEAKPVEQKAEAQNVEVRRVLTGLGVSPSPQDHRRLTPSRQQAESDFVNLLKAQCKYGLPDADLVIQIPKIKNGGLRNLAFSTLSACFLEFKTPEDALKAAALIEIDNSLQVRAYETILYALKAKGKLPEAIQLTDKLLAETTDAHHPTYKTSLARVLVELRKPAVAEEPDIMI